MAQTTSASVGAVGFASVWECHPTGCGAARRVIVQISGAQARAAPNRGDLGSRPGGTSCELPVLLQCENGARAGELVQRSAEESRERHLATAAVAKEVADERIV